MNLFALTAWTTTISKIEFVKYALILYPIVLFANLNQHVKFVKMDIIKMKLIYHVLSARPSIIAPSAQDQKDVMLVKRAIF